ncbi:hypothetical protein CWR48_04895 [Oceanobacillus arenosus]|uniref:Uncharacterized protein n=1 Tax=Oceanobacillus arenosus TaxID=1229153 RepID=A0A3D8PVK4_9BACI|nr:hypothetical protein [Oceanobacillus arenosus]RDW20064.1 hypothetical protein CWR48_04895 [Oceanobacillus arenosus]
MKMFLFEWKKIMKKKTTWIVLALSILAVMGVYVFNLILADNARNQAINQYDIHLNLILQDADHWALEKDKAMETEDEKLIEEATMRKQNSRSSYETLKAQKAEYENKEWDRVIQQQVDFLEIFAYPPPGQGASFGFEGELISNFTLRATYEEMNYLLSHKIEPFTQNIYGGTMVKTTIYDDFGGRLLEEWKKYTTRYGEQGVYFIYQLIQLLYIPILIVIGCFIFGNTLSSETTRKNNGLRFHQALPLNQSKLFFAKYTTGYLGILLFVLFMIGVPLLVGTVMRGFGSLEYPILVYDGVTTGSKVLNEDDAFHFIALKEYLAQTLLFTIVASLFIYSLYYLVSQFSKEPIFNVIIIGILSFVGMQIQHPYNPFSYLRIDKVITHEIQLQTWNAAFTYTTGIFITLTAGVICTMINFICFKYKSN